MRTGNCSWTVLRHLSATVLALIPTWAGAQQLPTPSSDAAAMAQMHKMPGRLVSKGSNEQPAGELLIKTYLLEELQLARPLQVDIGGKTTEITRSWRLTVTGGPFTVRAMPALIWIDDKLAGVGLENADLTKISVIIFDSSLLREGATIALGYGAQDPQRTELPEKLTLKAAR